jgi:hypothetical protein
MGNHQDPARRLCFRTIDYEPGAPEVEVARGADVCPMRNQLISQMSSIQSQM